MQTGSVQVEQHLDKAGVLTEDNDSDVQELLALYPWYNTDHSVLINVLLHPGLL